MTIDQEWIVIVPIEAVEVAIRIFLNAFKRLRRAFLDWMKFVVVLLRAPVEGNHVLVSFAVLVAEQSELPLDEGGVILELARGVVVLYGEGEARS